MKNPAKQSEFISDSQDTDLALERIADAALFERIATAALLIANPGVPLTHLGVNADRRTIRSAVDNMGFVMEGTVPRVYLVAHSTVPRQDLAKKWLFDHTDVQPKPGRGRRKELGDADDGDILKAARVYQHVLELLPTATATLFLTTNRTPPLEVMVQATAMAARHGLALRVFDRSQMVAVLDFTADGTAVRRRLLGIDTDRLSRGLLFEICSQSHRAYGDNHQFLGTDEWAARTDIVDEIVRAIRKGAALVGLVARPGFGKSALAWQFMHEQMSAGVPTIWAPEHLISGSVSVTSLIDRALRLWHPLLEQGAGEIVGQFTEGLTPSVIVVDDLMRLPDPTLALGRLHALASAARRPQGEHADGAYPFHAVFVVPAWPNVWATLGQDHLRMPWVRTIQVEQIPDDAAISTVQNALERRHLHASTLGVERACRKLQGDPYLLSVLVASAERDMTTPLWELADGVLERYVAGTLQRLSAKDSETLPVSEYQRSLHLLGERMLGERDLAPEPGTVRNWYSGDRDLMRGYYGILRQGALLFEDGTGTNTRIRFRHDRLRDSLLTSVLTNKASSGDLDPDLIADPLYATLAAAVLSSDLLGGIDLNEIARKSPAALAYALQFATGVRREQLVGALVEWSRSAQEDSNHVPTSASESVFQALNAFQPPELLEILAPWPSTRGLNMLRLGSGSVEAGLAEFRTEFAPDYLDSFRTRAIHRLLESRRDEVIAKVTEELDASVRDEDIRAALSMAGFMGLSTLSLPIDRAWRRMSNPEAAAKYGIWAASQCASEESASTLLSPLLRAWGELSSEQDGTSGRSPQSDVAYSLRAAFATGLSSGAANFLAKRLTDGDVLEHLLATSLYYVDDPNVLEAIVRYGGRRLERARAQQGFDPYVSMLATRWVTDIGRRSMSERSRTRLRELWEDVHENEFVRETALRVWPEGMGWEELKALQSIQGPGPLSKLALWRRCQLGDITALGQLLVLLANDRHWIHVAAPLWGPEMRALVERLLDERCETLVDETEAQEVPSLEEDYSMRDLLIGIPIADSLELISPRWAKLGRIPNYVQLALLLGSKDGKELVARSVAAGMRPQRFLEHIAVRIEELTVKRGSAVTRASLSVLEPYVGALSDSELWHLGHWCTDHGFTEWAVQHLQPLMSSDSRKRSVPTDLDLLEKLEEMMASQRHADWIVRRWVERASEEPLMIPRLLALAKAYVGKHPTVDGLKAAGWIIGVIGTRAEVYWLEAQKPDGDDHERSRVKAAVRFEVESRTGEGYKRGA